MSATDYISTAADWRVVCASSAGQAHLNQKTECQDRFACRIVETDADGKVLIAVVADGAGSASDGQRGAEIVCEIFVNEISAFLKAKNASVKSLNEDFGKRLIDFLRAKIGDLAKQENKQIREFASTLVGAVAGAETTAFFQIGDGAIVYSASGAAQSYRFGIAPQESLYVNMTDFATDDDAAEKLRFESLDEKIEDLILFSDGIFPVAVDYGSNQPHEPFLAPMIAPLRHGGATENLSEKLEKFLASPKINEKSDDDKTIILASRAALKTEGFRAQ